MLPFLWYLSLLLVQIRTFVSKARRLDQMT